MRRVLKGSQFVGREQELARLAELLETGKSLISIVGLGGVGKTRLASEFATLRPPNTCWVDLAETTGEAGVAHEVAHALDLALQPGADPVSEVGRALSRRSGLLVVLDNVEHVLSNVREVLASWIRTALECSFLATTRERIHLPGEQVIELAPLPVPEEGEKRDVILQSPAVTLFVELIGQFGVSIKDDEELLLVAQIVRQLEGLPLAIELAASWVDLLPLYELANRLEETYSLSRRSADTGLPRHRTLTDMLDWSWALLTEAETKALAQLSVFCGGFAMAQAESVLGLGRDHALEVLQSLRRKSLVRYDQASGRLGLPVIVREYARRAVDDLDGAPERHRHYFADFADRWRHEARRKGDAHLPSLAAEQCNLYEACASADLTDEGELTEASRILLGLYALATTRGPLGRFASLLDAIIAAPARDRVDVVLQAELHVARGGVLYFGGRQNELERELEIAMTLVNASKTMEAARTKARILNTAGVAAVAVGDLAKARANYEEALAFTDPLEDRAMFSHLLANLGVVASEEGDLNEARGLYERALAQYVESGDSRRQGNVLGNLGNVLSDEGRLAEAGRFYERAVDCLNRARDLRIAAIFTGMRGTIEHRLGNLTSAKGLYEEAAESLAGLGDRFHEAPVRGYLGAVLADLDDVGGAEEQIAYAAGLMARTGDAPGLAALDLHRVHVDLAKARTAAGPLAEVESAAHYRCAIARLRRCGESSASERVRVARRILRFALAQCAEMAGVEPIEIVGDGSFVRLPEGLEMDLSKRANLRRIVIELVRKQQVAPGRCLSTDEIFVAGWAETSINSESALNRVRVAIATLRRLGLRGYLLTGEQGYYLDPTIPVVAFRGPSDSSPAE